MSFCRFRPNCRRQGKEGEDKDGLKINERRHTREGSEMRMEALMARHSPIVDDFAILWGIVLCVVFCNCGIENPKWSLLFIFSLQICKQHFMANYRGRIFFLFV